MPDLQPTAKLRWVNRVVQQDPKTGSIMVRQYGLQQWWAPDVPSYMVDATQGEWRDVPTESE